MSANNEEINSLIESRYKHGFVTDIESDSLPPGLNEDVIRAISARKNEPKFIERVNFRQMARKKPRFATILHFALKSIKHLLARTKWIRKNNFRPRLFLTRVRPR